MMTSADAKALAAIQHAGQIDRDGASYINHLTRVVAGAEWRATWAQTAGLSVNIDHVMQAAWLHDIVADTPITLADLEAAGYALAVVTIVDLLTERDGAGTDAKRLGAILGSGNLDALIVKLADNADHANPARMLGNSPIRKRYRAARTQLLRAARELGYVEP